jgi:mannose-6-phosphate isomerase-like protein (cupin superfamily)
MDTDGRKHAMARDALVSDDLAQKFATEKESPYVRWVRDEGLDIIAAHYVPDLNEVELKDWPRRGGRGVFINHEASRTSNDCYVCEIPRAGELAPQRQLYEEMILVLSGHGSTSVWNDAGERVTFEWGPGSLFAIPLNAWHQHFNGSGQDVARFVASTNLPPVLNLYDEAAFVFNTPHDFRSRFAGEPDYFADKDEVEGLLKRTNFVADAIGLPLITAK